MHIHHGPIQQHSENCLHLLGRVKCCAHWQRLPKHKENTVINASHLIPHNNLTFRILMFYQRHILAPTAIYFQPHVFPESRLLFVRH